ncbi:hypothetical protein KUTeg_010014 [Tegillarca granosa]|uniref:Uncharacterized protein n=1 Tax=Tegillarca granosa TaxID=220873 RepID=A0ABQ9F8S8_TEGGR|nr:hypothetical protein KUTeg_010014 [Tegillarca granosa]
MSKSLDCILVTNGYFFRSMELIISHGIINNCTSRFVSVFGIIFMFIVSLSVILVAMETLPQFRKNTHTDEELQHKWNISNLTDYLQEY